MLRMCTQRASATGGAQTDLFADGREAHLEQEEVVDEGRQVEVGLPVAVARLVGKDLQTVRASRRGEGQSEEESLYRWLAPVMGVSREALTRMRSSLP